MIKVIKDNEFPEPSQKKNNVPIVMTSSEEFLYYSCITISSLLNCSDKKKFYDILLLCNEKYSKNGIALLEKTIEQYKNCSLHLVCVERYLDDSFHTEGHIQINTYARLLLPLIMKNYSDVIYLDSDLIVLKDVSKLLVPVPQDIMLSGVPDLDVLGQYYGPEISMRYYLKKKLKLQKPENYLQAGVLVFHIPAIRRLLGEKTLYNFGKKSRLRYFDQDILNTLCNYYIRLLDLRWNVVSDCNNYRVERIIKNAPMYHEYMESRRAPWIVHFSGGQKPWNDPDMDMSNYYYEAIYQVGFEKLTFSQSREKCPTKKLRVIDVFLPQQSLRRELCKVLYFFYKYYLPAQ